MRALWRVVVAMAVGLSVVAGGACGDIQERKERADRIIDSVDEAVAAGTAQMEVRVEADIQLDEATRVVVEAPDGSARPGTTSAAAADLAADRVAYVVPGPAGTPEPVRIYSGTTVFVRRVASSTRATDRPWVELDLTTLDPDEIDNDGIESADALRQVQTTQGFDNPLFLLKLLRGALTGSVEELGTEDVRGVPARHFKLNIDREKAVRDEDEEIQDAYEALFKTLFATRTVLPAEVWLDDRGLPLRYSLTFQSRVRRHDLVDTRLTVELFDIGRPVQIELPGKSETAKVEDLGGLAQAAGGGA